MTELRRSTKPRLSWGLFLIGVFLVATGADPIHFKRTGCSDDKRQPLAPGALTLAGRITDFESAAPVGGVQVALDGGAPRLTGADGTFSFEGLSAGTYHLTAAKEGFVDGTLGVTLNASTSDVVFPIRPIHTLLITTWDTYVTQATPLQGFPQAPVLIVGRRVSNSPARNFIGFKTDQIPAQSDILDARLNVTVLQNLNRINFTVNNVIEAWDPDGTTWLSQPNVSDTQFAALANVSGTALFMISFDMTDYVRTYLAGRPLAAGVERSHGISLLCDDSSPVSVASADHAAAPQQQALNLTVRYARMPPG